MFKGTFITSHKTANTNTSENGIIDALLVSINSQISITNNVPAMKIGKKVLVHIDSRIQLVPLKNLYIRAAK